MTASRSLKADAVVCGAGIAGIAAAHALVRDLRLKRVILVDEGAPLSLTSDKSTECYRNWWPGPGNAMVALSTRSIELMESLAEATGNAIRMDRRGYLYLSAEAGSAAGFEATARESESLGAGPLRIHQGATGGYVSRRGDGIHAQPDGADLILDPALIKREFGYAAPETCVALHVRRAGALSAQQLGMVMLEQAREGGTRLMRARLEHVEVTEGAVSAVVLSGADGEQRIETSVLVDSAGPYLRDVATLAGVDVPVECERHVKLTFDDREAIVPRDAPLSIWCDETRLAWTPDEAEALAEDEAGARLLAPFPAGVHGRPVGAGASMMLYWTYDCPIETPSFPVTWDDEYPEILLRGMSVMIPGLARYHDHLPNAFLDGGYYTKTPENRPLVGPTTVDGFYLCGAFSGFGIMIAMGAGELLATHVGAGLLPEHASAFALSRYDDQAYQDLLDGRSGDGQI
jgi:glycine/D-amino acid oxidase-like deaminating enzyme